MAIDLAAIRRKVQQLQTGRATSRTEYLKLPVGKHVVRALPWPESETQDGQPFVELFFYYIGDNYGFLAPNQFGLEDPIADLRKKLYDSGDPNDREIAKQLRPKMRTYLPVVVRGKEDEGVKIWSFGKGIYQKLLDYFLTEDTQDWLNPKTGFDLNLNITKTQGKKYNDTDAELGRKSSPLANSPEEIQRLIDAVPTVQSFMKQKSTAEIEKLLNDWLSDGAQSESDGESRNAPGNVNDALDALAEDVKSAKTSTPALAASPSKKVTKKSTDKKDSSELDSLVPESSSLDDAFDDLMSDED